MNESRRFLSREPGATAAAFFGESHFDEAAVIAFASWFLDSLRRSVLGADERILIPGCRLARRACHDSARKSGGGHWLKCVEQPSSRLSKRITNQERVADILIERFRPADRQSGRNLWMAE